MFEIIVKVALKIFLVTINSAKKSKKKRKFQVESSH